MSQLNAHAGPSRICLPSSQPLLEPDSEHSAQTANYTAQSQRHSSTAHHGDNEGSDEDEEEERMSVNYIQSFASKVQHLPTGSHVDGSIQRVKIVVPKRGEKDFEPVQEMVNLQDMMLQKSREALFNALAGVRGGNIKSITQALISPATPYPRVLAVRGHLLDHMGVSVRQASSHGKSRINLALLPEEALYLLERGSAQIWVGLDAEIAASAGEGLGEWSEESHSVKGATEMSVQEGFARFIGSDGLTWQRYQAYAYLRRLGYTVYRTRHFIPQWFLEERSGYVVPTSRASPEPFRTWWLSIPGWVASLARFLGRSIRNIIRTVHQVGLGGLYKRQTPLPGSMSAAFSGNTYGMLLENLRRIPHGHSTPLPSRADRQTTSDPYEPLARNPYLPFFHVWKPNTPWSKSKWDKGSEVGLAVQQPDYVVAVVDSRLIPMPTIQQLSEVFDTVFDEPKGPATRRGPQYQNKTPAFSQNHNQDPVSWKCWLLDALGLSQKPQSHSNLGNILGRLRTGDRALIVAVNDSGNTGWVRFGRTGFADSILL